MRSLENETDVEKISEITAKIGKISSLIVKLTSDQEEMKVAVGQLVNMEVEISK